LPIPGSRAVVEEMVVAGVKANVDEMTAATTPSLMRLISPSV
jgi:hypothetical protein